MGHCSSPSELVIVVVGAAVGPLGRPRERDIVSEVRARVRMRGGGSCWGDWGEKVGVARPGG